MRKMVRMAWALTMARLLTAITVQAQVQNGNLSVKAVDDQGAVMPGATVTLTSPILPRAIEGTVISTCRLRRVRPSQASHTRSSRVLSPPALARTRSGIDGTVDSRVDDSVLVQRGLRELETGATLAADRAR